MKILVTGFDPFGTDTINPSWEAVKRLPDEIAGHKILKVEVPTVYGRSAEVVAEWIDAQQPNVVINVGQAGGRKGITPEKVAINLDDARIKDNEGNQPLDQPIQVTGDAAYFTQLPVKAIVTRLQESGIAAGVSYSAGTFVCNHLMYQMQYLIAEKYPKLQSGFIHVPFIPEQVTDRPELPAMELSEITRGLALAIETVIAFQGKEDLAVVGGTTH